MNEYRVQMYIKGRWSDGRKFPNERSALAYMEKLHASSPGDAFRVIHFVVMGSVGAPK